MKVKSKRNLLTVMLSVMCAVLLFCSVGLLSGTNRTANAKAPTTGTDVIIGDLTINADGTANSNGKVFNGEKLAELYDAILGTGYTGGGTFNKVKALLDSKGTAKLGSGVTTKALNATDFRTLGGKDIYVTFGGIEWEVVYLTTNRSGEIILDLWQAESSIQSQYSAGAGYQRWDNTYYAYVGNIYSTSYLRCYTLGLGGTYLAYSTNNQTNTGSILNVSQNDANQTWASFITGNFSSYIDAPINLDYQEKQSYVELVPSNSSVGHVQPNDAYGTPTTERYYGSGNVNTNYSNVTVGGVPANPKTDYDLWKNDKIWLPSTTEVAIENNAIPQSAGIWGVSKEQRKNDGATQTMLRTGATSTSANQAVISPDGTDGSSSINLISNIRPALHLNLTKAEADSDITEIPVPQDVTVDYASGVNNWIDSLETMTDTSGNLKYKWIDSTLHNDTSIVSLVDIKYTSLDALGNTVTA
ncbi:MAG: hypothetical protein K2I30_03855, partial [Clostridia bacterium]|nr:hypothetical protein [Clostridia bacterium]MDE5721857.1 hypothetical protein [Clostridia bacterium]